MSTPVTDATHPTDRDLVRYLDDEATATERERARDHLRECSTCHRRFEILSGRSAALSAMIQDMEVPEREIPPPRDLTRGRSVSRRTRSSARTSPWVLRAAAIVLLVAAPAMAMVQPVRDWISTQWSELVAERNPTDDAAPNGTSPHGTVSFVPAGSTLALWLEREPGPGTLRIVTRETNRVTVETVGDPAGSRLVVLPDGVRIEGGSEPGARYVITVPHTLERVVVYVAGSEHAVVRPGEVGAESLDE